ncbi:MAG: RsbRD N-terminal domain-containing protein [Desulfotignum sp.]|nr:RsbRD N-terminal domain-containing protein [Desulfotignum sp.]MCF8113963.1 RsbRD N-terminal domain-containing protein [Desulfotignum sp.]MCF8125705.1 RsbRD N-terminal domain-containing protein [Desulfotignum sp.]
MTIKQCLKDNHNRLLKQWFQATINTYPAQSAKILGKDVDRFDNPVGAVTRETLEDILHLLASDYTADTLEKALDPVIRIRAVQAFSAAEAVSFIFALKDVGETIMDSAFAREFDRMVDQVVLAGFNRLMKCREDIFLLKATESKRRIHAAFERAGLVQELKEEDLLGSKKS